MGPYFGMQLCLGTYYHLEWCKSHRVNRVVLTFQQPDYFTPLHGHPWLPFLRVIRAPRIRIPSTWLRMVVESPIE